MDNSGRLYSQVAAEAGVSPDKAMIACYLSNLSAEGKSIGEACALMRQPRPIVRDYARDWGISFSDYRPSPQPLLLEWRKERRGRWVLKFDGLIVAEAESDGEGGYVARQSDERDWTVTGSSADVAIRRMSNQLERASFEIFGVDDVVVSMFDTQGHRIHLALASGRREAA